MKKILGSLAVLIFCLTFKVYATDLPQFQQTIMKASLEEQDSEGKEIGWGLGKELEMKAHGQPLIASQLKLTEETFSDCGSAKCPVIANISFFVITNQMVNRCGSTRYFAEEMQVDASVRPARHLILIDNRLRHCEQGKPFIWQASLVESGKQSSQRKFFGNPEAVQPVRLPVQRDFY